MKFNYLLLCACLVYFFTACNKPPFDLNAPYQDVTVVYGVLSYQDSIHYVKIYRGFQSHEQGGVSIHAQNPDSIYYYDQINVVLKEYQDNRWTSRDIPLQITKDFPRDAGFFYYGEERIIYYTTESLSKDMEYKIVITHRFTEKITDARTPMVHAPEITSTHTFDMTKSEGNVAFKGVKDAGSYEIHVNFVYFEVDKKTNQVVKIGKVVRNVTPRIGEQFELDAAGDIRKKFTQIFYEDIAAQVKENPNVIRYMGRPGNNGSCIEIDVWAAGESMVDFLLSNQPTNSFVQINTIYTNMEASKGLAFGFLSSRAKSTKNFAVTDASETELIRGSKTKDLGFRPWTEYRP